MWDIPHADLWLLVVNEVLRLRRRRYRRQRGVAGGNRRPLGDSGDGGRCGQQRFLPCDRQAKARRAWDRPHGFLATAGHRRRRLLQRRRDRSRRRAARRLPTVRHRDKPGGEHEQQQQGGQPAQHGQRLAGGPMRVKPEWGRRPRAPEGARGSPLGSVRIEQLPLDRAPPTNGGGARTTPAA